MIIKDEYNQYIEIGEGKPYNDHPVEVNGIAIPKHMDDSNYLIKNLKLNIISKIYENGNHNDVYEISVKDINTNNLLSQRFFTNLAIANNYSRNLSKELNECELRLKKIKNQSCELELNLENVKYELLYINFIFNYFYINKLEYINIEKTLQCINTWLFNELQTCKNKEKVKDIEKLYLTTHKKLTEYISAIKQNPPNFINFKLVSKEELAKTTFNALLVEDLDLEGFSNEIVKKMKSVDNMYKYLLQIDSHTSEPMKDKKFYQCVDLLRKELFIKKGTEIVIDNNILYVFVTLKGMIFSLSFSMDNINFYSLKLKNDFSIYYFKILEKKGKIFNSNKLFLKNLNKNIKYPQVLNKYPHLKCLYDKHIVFYIYKIYEIDDVTSIFMNKNILVIQETLNKLDTILNQLCETSDIENIEKVIVKVGETFNNMYLVCENIYLETQKLLLEQERKQLESEKEREELLKIKKQKENQRNVIDFLDELDNMSEVYKEQLK